MVLESSTMAEKRVNVNMTCFGGRWNQRLVRWRTARQLAAQAAAPAVGRQAAGGLTQTQSAKKVSHTRPPDSYERW